MNNSVGSSQQVDLALVASLLDGAFETQPWDTFLNGLRVSTGADFAMLHFRPPGRPLDDTMDLISGNIPIPVIRDVTQTYFHADEPSLAQILEEGRPYSMAELMALNGSQDESFQRYVVDRNIGGLRQMRVQETTGVNAWLTIVRLATDFSPSEDALLRSLAPVLRGVLRLYVAMERERFVSSLTLDATHRLKFGWLTLDNMGRVLDHDDQGLRILQESAVLGINANRRLTATSAKLNREINLALSKIAATSRSRAYAITVTRDPWLDMLLVPTSRRSISTATSPAVIAYLHGDSWHSVDCCEQLADLFTLTPSEAKFALAICRGMSIAEAAEEMAISVGSARTYSKSIYAKTGARGLPDLVRIVMKSVLAISPKT